MKFVCKILVLLALSTLPVLLSAQKLDLAELYKNRPEIYFSLDVKDPAEVKKLSTLISIDGFSEDGVTAYASAKQFEQIKAKGYQPKLLMPPSLIETVSMTNTIDSRELFEWDTYPTYDAYVQLMQDFENDYPDHCEVFNFGTLSSGRELLMARINNGEAEGKPKFLYTATMHGDETAGYVLTLRLIDYLLSNYGTDPRVTNIVDKLDIFINPLANPDGTFYGGNNTVNGSIRGNANGIDLNRNYPDPEDGPHPDGNAYQAETIAFMELAEQYQFVMAANFHGGAEVVNYPWDTWARLHADDAWWVMVSREYADSAQFYSPAGYLTDLNNGITNGYAWYSVAGGRQDYMNYFRSCREFVLEISDIKTLPANQLPAFWTYNKASMLSYLEQATYGLHGTITDAISGEPIEAMIAIEGHDLDNSHVYSNSNDGSYFRPLKAGSWSVTYSAEGYYPQTIALTTSDYETTIQNIELDPGTLIADFTASAYSIAKGESINFSNTSYGQNIVSYEWIFEGGEPATSTVENPQNIVYNETGNFDVQLTITDSDGESSTILKEDLIEVNLIYLMQNGTFNMCDGIFYDAGGPDNDYGNDQDLVMTILPDEEEALVKVDFLSFSVEEQASCNYDWLKIFDGTSTMAPLIGTYCGSTSPGELIASNEAGALTFQFHSDGSVTEFGWAAQVSCTSTVSLSEKRSSKIAVWPNPSSDRLINIESAEPLSVIELIDMQGNMIWQKETSQKREKLNLTVIPAGIYMLKLELQHGTVINKKIVLQ
jgi:PKD repeat protein